MANRGFIYRGETRVLDHDVRSSIPGEFIELADGFVHYELGGSSGAQMVVLVPGFSIPLQVWDPTYHALIDAGYRVLRYDLYGRGFSDRPDSRYDLDFFNRQLVGLLEALDISAPIDLVGLSLGGAISVVFADQHRGLIRKLALLDPAGLPWTQSMPARLSKAPIFGELLFGLIGSHRIVTKLADHFFSDRMYSELKDHALRQMQFIGFKRALLSTLRSGAITGASQAFASVGKLDFPVLLIWGKEDHVVPYKLSQKVLELIPRAEFHAIEEAAHAPHFENPDIVNPILIDFLNRSSDNISDGEPSRVQTKH